MDGKIEITKRSLEGILRQAKVNIETVEKEFGFTDDSRFLIGYAIRDLRELYQRLFGSNNREK